MLMGRHTVRELLESWSDCDPVAGWANSAGDFSAQFLWHFLIAFHSVLFILYFHYACCPVFLIHRQYKLYIILYSLVIAIINTGLFIPCPK